MKYRLLTPGEHPRLLFSSAEVEQLQKRLQDDEALRASFDAWKSKADEQLSAEWLTEEYADSVYTQHGNYYDIGAMFTRMATTFGPLYCLTGSRVYAEKLRDGMLWYGRFRCWTGPLNKDRDTPWTSDLSTTRILYAYALAYDCIYDALTEEERTAIRAVMLKNGIRPLLNDWVLPNTRVHALDSMGHNWWSVCVSLAGVGLCSICEDVPEADEWLDGIFGALHGFCTYSGSRLLNKVQNFDSKGLFYESAGYFSYGVSELMRFAFVFSRSFENGKELTRFEHMDEAVKAFMVMSYPTSDAEHPLLFPNFGDSNLYGKFLELPKYMLLCGYDVPEMRYAYRMFSEKPDLFSFFYPELLSSTGTLCGLPKDMLFEESGYAYLRDTWAPDATLLAVRCGYTWNHAHSDAGHFMLFADGEPVVTEAGKCTYDRPEYSSYFRTSHAHNVVLVNGEGQRGDALFRGSKFSGTLSDPVFGEMKYLLADATGPAADVCNRNYRSFLWLCPDVLVTIDDLRTHEPAQFSSLLHCSAQGTLCGNTAVFGGKTPLKATVVHPAAAMAEERTGFIEEGKEIVEKPYCAFVLPGKTDVAQILTVYGLHAAAGADPQPLAGKNWIGTELHFGGDTYRVAYNLLADGRKMHENSSCNLLGYDTDAYILAVKQHADGRQTILMAYGSYLRKDGESLYESFTKDFVEL